MEINKIGDVVIKSVEDYPVSEDNHVGDLSYFAPTINQDYSTYMPPYNYSIGRSAYVDFDASPFASLELRPYSTLDCKFGEDFKLTVKLDLVWSIVGNRYDNAYKIAEMLYSESSAYGSYQLPNLEKINMPYASSYQSPLFEESVNIIKREYDTVKSGLYVESVVLQPQAKLPTGEATGDCGVTGPLWGKVDVDSLNQGLYDTEFFGDLYLGTEEGDRESGIFRGYIDVNIPIRCETYINEIGQSTQTCGSYLTDFKTEILRARVNLKVSTGIYDGTPSVFHAHLFNNGNIETKKFHGDFNLNKSGNIYDTNFYFEQVSDTDFLLFYRSAIMQSGKPDQPYYTLFASEYYSDGVLISRELFASGNYSTQGGVYSNNKSPYDTGEWFIEMLQQAQILPLSYGVTGNDGYFNIPEYNLTGIPTNKIYNLLPVTESIRQTDYYTFNNGLYTALVDVYNKHLYIILADGAGFYDCSLAEITSGNILNYINLDDENLILGVIDPSAPVWNPLKYLKINFNLNRFKIKPRVIVYDFNKIGLTFIPCHTHCMGKGGITSKV